MGLFSKADPISKLTQEVEKNPKDTRLALELAGMLKAKGALAAALDHYMRAVTLFAEKGFDQKAVSVARQVISFSPDHLEAHEYLARHYEKLNLKEDLRSVLKGLSRIYNSTARPDDRDRVKVQLEKLGPGR